MTWTGNADDLVQQLFTLAQRIQDPNLLAIAHYTVANNLSTTGEFASGRDHFEQSLALYETQGRRSVASLMGGEELAVVCRSFLALTLWPLGYLERALQRADEALQLARQLRSPYDLAFALSTAATLHRLRGEPQLTRERAETAINIATEQGFPWLAAAAYVELGSALVQQNQPKNAIPQILRSMQDGIESSYDLPFVSAKTLLAEAYYKAGKTEASLSTLNEAENWMNKTGTRYYEAEPYRLRGELSLSQNETKEAEIFFRRAIGVARQQSAKSWELRASADLARLLVEQGKRAEAHAMLAEIYAWFTEGFDTADLKKARELLDELSKE